MERLNNLEPQEQAEQMMQDAVKHFEGVPEMIVSRTGSWQGKIANTHNWQVVELEARYSSDLRVRDAAIEVDLVISGLDRNADSVRRLIEDAAANPANHPADSVILGMLANRGIETDRVHSTLRTWAHDPSEETRYWAIEGLAFLGTDDTIDDFIEVLRSDPALNVRQRCGASLAKSGMLTREQRMKAVPGLIDIAADPNQDSTTRGWAFQALHEITAETISAEAGAWRSWYDAHGSERIEQFHNMNRNWILGNS
jgi:HEAT repeat protein